MSLTQKTWAIDTLFHIRKFMRDALVAIDAGLFAFKQESLVSVRCTLALTGEIHRLLGVTVPALQAVIAFVAVPFTLSQFEALGLKLFAGIDCPN